MNSLKIRQSNFELMRIISMFMIVIYHIIIHGNIIENISSPSHHIFFTFIKSLTLIGVNSFIILTGYFQSKTTINLKKILVLILQLFFYKIIIFTFFTLFKIIPFNIETTLKYFSLKELEYWFIFYYIILYLLSPLLNNIIKKISFKNYTIFIIILTMLFSIIPMLSNNIIIKNNGFSLQHFIYLYFIGAYIRIIINKYNYKNNNKIKYITLFNYLLFSTLIVIIFYSIKDINTNNIIINGIKKYSFLYSNPLVLIQSISYFLFFYNLKLNNNKINNISKYIIGIYLIHDNLLIRQRLYLFTKTITNCNSIIVSFIYLIFLSIIIFTFSYLINYIITKLFFKLKKANQAST